MNSPIFSFTATSKSIRCTLLPNRTMTSDNCNFRQSERQSTPMENIVAILRVSTKKQLKGEGIPGQLADIQKDAKDKGQQIVHQIVIAETASKEYKRHTFEEAIEWILKNKKKYQIAAAKIANVDRFSRSGPNNYYMLKTCLTKVGIRLESAKEEINDTPSGEAMEGFLAVFARLDSRMRTDRTIGAEITMTGQGWWCRPAPTGFKNIAVACNDEAGNPITRPSLAPCDDKKQWELLCYGLRKQMTGAPPVEVARNLASKGFLMRPFTKKGKTVQNLVSEQSWLKMCRSAVYGGLNREKWTDNKLIRAKWNGPLTPEEWHQLQKVVNKGKEDRLVKRRRKLDPEVPLRRFLRCPHCEAPVRGYGSLGKLKNKKHYYYDCPTPGCKFSIKPDAAHTLFLDFMQKIRPTKELLELFDAIVVNTWEKEFTELSRASIDAANRLTALKEERLEIMKMMKLSKDNPALYKNWEEQFNKKTAEIDEATPERNQNEVEEYKAEKVMSYCRHYLEHVSELWEKADVIDQNLLQRLALPDGIHYDVFQDKRTPKLSLVYEAIKDIELAGNDLAAPAGIEPALPG